jgi:pyridoxal phosphate enzyme (YggS family)
VLSRDEIRANVAAVNARIEAACARAGRDRRDVTLVAVSKTFPAEAVSHAVATGITDIGENRVQEAREKWEILCGAAALGGDRADHAAEGGGATWHLIGHLQSNKAKDAVRIFDMIETVDSAGLAEKIAKAAEAAGKRQEILLQINIGREDQKSGADPRDAASIMRSIESMDSLLLRGLMTIPPADDDPRRWFREMRAIRDDLGLKELSMGMSEDYEIAIEEGSTIIRVGRAIFGSRG